jgi:hypothetical protein
MACLATCNRLWLKEVGFAEEREMVYRGCVQNGLVVLDGDVRLVEGASVMVEIPDAPPPCIPDDPVYRLGELAVRTGIADLAVNIDHYLYGHPKASDA